MKNRMIINEAVISPSDNFKKMGRTISEKSHRKRCQTRVSSTGTLATLLEPFVCFQAIIFQSGSEIMDFSGTFLVGIQFDLGSE